MTTVRGSKPLELGGTPEITADWYGQKVVIKTAGWDTRGRHFQANAAIGVHCAVRMIREMRKALRYIRDQQVATLNKAVNDAEGNL